MKSLILAAILIVLLGGACGLNNKLNPPATQGSGNVKTDSRNVVGFKKIRAENAIELNVTVTNGFTVTVKADDNIIANVKTELQGDTLVVSLKDKVDTKSKINVTVSMPELTDLDLTGATTCAVTGIKADDFKVNATGAAKVKLDGTVKTLNAKAVGASSIDAENLKAEKADVESVAASNITVAASDELKADASGASSVTYIGDPKQLKQNSSDASTIKKK